MDHSHSRRQFMQRLALFSGAFAASPLFSSTSHGAPLVHTPRSLGEGDEYLCRAASPIGPLEQVPSRLAGAQYMGNFAAPKIEGQISVSVIGCGARGEGHILRMLAMLTLAGIEITALCDLDENMTARTARMVKNKTGQEPKLYHGDARSYELMLRESPTDVVLIATPWELHASMAIAAMRAGAHAFVEVPLGLSITEIWDVVNTSEQTRKHCFMMENVCYGREELLFLNIVRQGVLGKLLHGEASYIHELKKIMKHTTQGEGIWRTAHYAARAGNLYPTHGLGPVAQYMGLARQQDNFGRLVSYCSPAHNHADYAQRELPADSPWRKTEFSGGDMSTSIIKTTYGKTILVQWDESTPRPYSRLNLIQGTLGTLAGFPTRVAGEKLGDGDYHQWTEGDALAAVYEKYEHPLWKRAGAIAAKVGGHGGMDYIMLLRAFESLREGQPMDQNVYEGAFWSAVSELTERSVVAGGAPQYFPDFTRGDWKSTPPLGIIQ